MKTYLLAWNPVRYPVGSLRDELAAVADSESQWIRWSVGNNTHIAPGDRLFLIRLGQDPRGMVGSGWAVSQPFDAPHWDPERRDAGEVANYVDIAFDVLVEEPMLPIGRECHILP